MAEGYKSAMIASLRGDAPQGPRMGEGVNPLMFDWMQGSGSPLIFEARRAALLNPQRFELPFPLQPPVETGGDRRMIPFLHLHHLRRLPRHRRLHPRRHLPLCRRLL
jgi:hypothetical protein